MKREPALIVGLVTAAVLAMAGQFNVVLDEVHVEGVVAPIIAALVTRQKVSPA